MNSDDERDRQAERLQIRAELLKEIAAWIETVDWIDADRVWRNALQSFRDRLKVIREHDQTIARRWGL